MVEIVKFKNKDDLEVYTLVHNGKLMEEANRFLIDKGAFGGRGGKKLASGSQRQYAYHMKYLFDIILKSTFHNQWTQLTINDLISIRNKMDQGENALNRGVINIRTQLWAEFFFWCRNNGYDHSMHIKSIKANGYNYNDDNFLVHTQKEKYITKTELWLPKVNNSKVFRTLSQTTWKKLRKELRNIDPVYEAIAMVMINTGLRINGAMQLNKTSFLPYPELDTNEELSFEYIPKGQKDTKLKYTCIFPIDTWGWLHDNIMRERKIRAKLHKKKFRKATHAMFLKKTGMPVKDFDVWKAFTTASEKVGEKLTPHMLRHTFATWTVMVWAEEEGIRPTSESFYKSIHDMLSEQLGHKNISTTKQYCRTASMLSFKKIMPKVADKGLNKLHLRRSFDALQTLGFDTGL